MTARLCSSSRLSPLSGTFDADTRNWLARFSSLRW